MRWIVVLLLLLPTLAAANPAASPSALCRAAIAAAERAAGVPDRLMQSIGAIESGRRDETGAVSAWPWTINAEGTGAYFNSKAEAIAAVTALRARGVRSIDVGCMQVNLMHHPDAFTSLDDAFDPGSNTRYAARFLNRLLLQTGSWPAATAGYHSLTPEIGSGYARKVLAVWAKPPTHAPEPAPAPPPQPAGSTLAFSGGGRIIPLAGASFVGPGQVTGRGLDAYRAAPTRLAARYSLPPPLPIGGKGSG